MPQALSRSRRALVALLCAGCAAQAQIEIEPGEMPVRTPLPPGPAATLSGPTRPAAPRVRDHRPAADVVFFGGGDRMSGEWISGFGAEPGISWRSAHARAPAEFSADRVVAMILKSRPAPGGGTRTGQIELAGGDLLPGDLIELTPERAVLDTWFSGRLSLDRASLFRVIPTGIQSHVLYEGPGTGEDWIQARGANAPFTFRRGVMIAQNNGMASLKVEFPERYQVEMEMRSRTGQFFVQIGLQVEKPNDNNEGYWLELMQNMVRFSRRSAREGQQYLGNIHRPQMGQGLRPMRLHMLVDRKAGNLSLLMDGELVQTWSLPDPLDMKGEHLSLVLQNAAGYEVRNVRVALWDGRMPGAPETPVVAREDMLKFLNEDSLSGALGTIQGGKARFRTSFAEMEVPVDRIESIVLAGRTTPPALPAGARKVLISFWGRGHLTAELRRMEQEALTVHHPAIGEFRIPLGAVERIDFNLDEPWRKDEDIAELTEFAGDWEAGGWAPGGGMPAARAVEMHNLRIEGLRGAQGNVVVREGAVRMQVGGGGVIRAQGAVQVQAEAAQDQAEGRAEEARAKARAEAEIAAPAAADN